MYEARVIADSICAGHRLTTMQLTHPRIVHAEFMTHCMFARNGSSSRAIPFNVTVQRVFDDPYVPRTFGINQKGMQPAAPLVGWKLERARELWLRGRDLMAETGREMTAVNCVHCNGIGWVDGLGKCNACHGTGEGLNIHKELANRLTETWQWITLAVTGTWDAWSNYFALRCHQDAQEALYDQAMMAQKSYFLSRPESVQIGDWHLPYVDKGEIQRCWTQAPEISVGRCARTSYLTQEGKRDFAEDLRMFERLAGHSPMHASPMEHVCQAMGDDQRYGKYTGWKAYRHMLEGEYVTDFKPNHPDLVWIDDQWASHS